LYRLLKPPPLPPLLLVKMLLQNAQKPMLPQLKQKLMPKQLKLQQQKLQKLKQQQKPPLLLPMRH
jgi:hypothetical protein